MTEHIDLGGYIISLLLEMSIDNKSFEVTTDDWKANSLKLHMMT
jgi:hypothetical protein